MIINWPMKKIIEPYNKDLACPPKAHSSNALGKKKTTESVPLNLSLKDAKKLVCPCCGKVVPASYIKQHLLRHNVRYTHCLNCTKAIKTRDYRVHFSLCVSKSRILRKQLKKSKVKDCSVQVNLIDVKLFIKPKVILTRLPQALLRHFE